MRRLPLGRGKKKGGWEGKRNRPFFRDVDTQEEGTRHEWTLGIQTGCWDFRCTLHACFMRRWGWRLEGQGFVYARETF